MSRRPPYDAAVIGGSAGGMEALEAILSPLPADYPIPIIVVSHLHKSDAGGFAEHLASKVRIQVVEAVDKQPIEPPAIYTAPADYHLLVERGDTLALSVDRKINWARPSIDVLFESAATTYGERLIAVILSGANDDGALGMLTVKRNGGRCLAMAPESARSPFMPQAAIEIAKIDEVLPPEGILEILREAGGGVHGQS